MAGKDSGIGYSITLPKQAVEIIDNLSAIGIYGDKRAVITRNLVLDAIKRLIADGVVTVDDLKRPTA